MACKLSIIIPCFHDETALSDLLPRLVAASSSFDIEILVVDGAKSERCKEIVYNIGGLYLQAETGRGTQITQGVKAAAGSFYWFLHADAIVSSESLKVVLGAVEKGADAGYFRFAFAGTPSHMTRFLTYWINLRSKIGGIAYGDQGLFVEANLYHELGGHSPLPLFEEVALMRKLKRRRMLTLLNAEIRVDPRRWQRDGFLKRTIVNRACALAYMCGVPAEKVARWYRASKTSQNSDLHK